MGGKAGWRAAGSGSPASQLQPGPHPTNGDSVLRKGPLRSRDSVVALSRPERNFPSTYSQSTLCLLSVEKIGTKDGSKRNINKILHCCLTGRGMGAGQGAGQTLTHATCETLASGLGLLTPVNQSDRSLCLLQLAPIWIFCATTHFLRLFTPPALPALRYIPGR